MTAVVAASDGDAMIRLEHVSKKFPGSIAAAVTDLSLDVPEGEIVVLVGPSGCGKTTTLKMINRLIEPSGGTITVAGHDIRDRPPAELRRGIGYVIQQIGLLPHRTIAANIATVPKLLGWDKARIGERVDELIELVGLSDDMRDRYPSELSGGQRQRVGVARALAADPPVLLMDEPFGAVDPIVRGRLQRELLNLQQTLHKTIVVVTHDIDEAILLGDRIAILNIGGRLAQYATPTEILAEPASDFVADFLGEERGLKRLSLLVLGQLDIPRGPVVELTDTAATARRAMTDHGTDWVGILDRERLLGWAWADDLPVSGPIDGVSPRAFLATLPSSASLRQAVDAVVRAHNQVAVVIDGDRFVGMLFVDQIARELQR